MLTSHATINDQVYMAGTKGDGDSHIHSDDQVFLQQLKA